MPKVKPRYTHDCTNCRFLGRLASYDIYLCLRCDNATMLARHSSLDSDYASSGFMYEKMKAEHRRCGGLTDDEAYMIAFVNALPSLLLNEWKRA